MTAEGGVRVTTPWWRDGWLQLYAALLVLTVVAGVIASTGRLGGLVDPAPISEQIEDAKREVLRGPRGRHVVVDERVRFHGGEADSWLLVVQDRPSHDEFDAAARDDTSKPPPSDEIRVYDVKDGRLKLRLHFQPKPVNNRFAAAWRTIGGDAPFATDYDDDGSKEVMAGYEIPAEATSAVVPFAITWGRSGYRLVALTPDAPRLSDDGLDRETARFRKEAYAQRRLENSVPRGPSRGLVLKGYRVQAFALVDKPAPRLLTGYFVKFPALRVVGQRNVMELKASQFRTSALEPLPCTPESPSCPAPPEQQVSVPPDRNLHRALVTAWEKVGSKWSREVRVVERDRGASD